LYVPDKIKEFCYFDKKGKYKTLEDCVLSDECFSKHVNALREEDFLTNRSFPINQKSKYIYEKILQKRIQINKDHPIIKYENVNDIIARLINDDRIIVLSESHTSTSIKFLSNLLDSLKEKGFNYFLVETGQPDFDIYLKSVKITPVLRDEYNYNYKEEYVKYFTILYKLCREKDINFVNIETHESWSHNGKEIRTSFILNNIWTSIGNQILEENEENKVIYFIGNDHAGFGSERFQTVPYILNNPITLKLNNSTQNFIQFERPVESSNRNYLTLYYT
jgi:hypothetical protein